MRSSLSSLIKAADIFSHRVSLTFNKRGSQFSTVIGGTASILLGAVCLIIVIVKLAEVGDSTRLSESRFTVSEA